MKIYKLSISFKGKEKKLWTKLFYSDYRVPSAPNERPNFSLSIEQITGCEPPAICKDVTVLILLSGTLRIYANHRCYELEEDGIFMLNPRQAYAVQTLTGEALVLVIQGDRDNQFGGQIDYYFGNAFFYDLPFSEEEKLYRFAVVRYYAASICDRVFYAEERADLFDAYGVAICLQAYLIKYFAKIHKMPRIDPTIISPYIQETISYTSKNFLLPLSLDEVSKRVGKNRSYFSNAFKKQTGIGWYDYLTFLRLQKAVSLLNETSDTLADVALSSGFCDNKAFFTAFKRFYSISPKEYRNINHKSAAFHPVLHNDYLWKATLNQKIIQYKENPNIWNKNPPFPL